MSVQTRRMTAEQFERFAALPENTHRQFEHIGGEVIEGASNQRSSMLAARISGYLFAYLLQNPLGFLTGADGGYRIAGESYIPDAAFVSKARQAEVSDRA